MVRMYFQGLFCPIDCLVVGGRALLGKEILEVGGESCLKEARKELGDGEMK